MGTPKGRKKKQSKSTPSKKENVIIAVPADELIEHAENIKPAKEELAEGTLVEDVPAIEHEAAGQPPEKKIPKEPEKGLENQDGADGKNEAKDPFAQEGCFKNVRQTSADGVWMDASVAPHLQKAASMVVDKLKELTRRASETSSTGFATRDADDAEEKHASVTHGDKAKLPSSSFVEPSNPTKTAKSETTGNELTELIPGYTAPMKLDSSSLEQYRPKGGIAELRRREEIATASKSSAVASKVPSFAEMCASFKRGAPTKRTVKDGTAGANWFGMVSTPMTDELKTDLAVIRNRNYLDPKRFYKSADTNSKVIQVGTVIEGNAEFYSARLSKKQRRANLTEEIMADPESADYTRNKFRKMQQEKTLQAQKRKSKKRRGHAKRRHF